MSSLATSSNLQTPKPSLSWREKLRAYIQLTRFDKPVGIELVFWSTLWAVMLAGADYQRLPPLKVFMIFAIGAVLMRAAGCAINDFADRKVDGAVARTQSRPLADGRLSGKEAVGAFVILSLISGSLLFLLPVGVFYWACMAVVLAFIYPFMKRFTHLPQFFLAMAFGWAIPMAYVAVSTVLQPELGLRYFPNGWCWLLFIGYMCWTVAYDTQYAMTDREDDLKIGIKSTAILFGNYDVAIISGLQGAFLLCLAGVLAHYFGLISVLGLLPVVAMFYRQNKKCLTYQPNLCFDAFLDNVWVGRYVFVLILALCWVHVG